MPIPTLVVSNPPHRDVDLDAAARVLGLDVYTTRLKSVFRAPEVMEAATLERANDFARALRSTGFEAAVLPGLMLARLPWPDPVTALSLEGGTVQLTIGRESLEIPSDAEVLCVVCQPPAERGGDKKKVDVAGAVGSRHGPTIAEAIQRLHIVDLYFRDPFHEETLRRATIVPDFLKLDGEELLTDLKARLGGLRLDDRLVGVRPRAAYVPTPKGAPTDGTERRRYSYGTLMLYRALESIAPGLRAIPQYELGSRLAYALGPLGGVAGPR